MQLNTRRMSDLEQTLTGDGAITITDNVVSTSATGLGDRAYLSRYVDADGGSTLTIEVDAARVTGEPAIIVDIVNKDGATTSQAIAKITIDSDDWQTHKMVVTMPPKYSQSYAFKVNFGVFNQEGGSGKFYDLRMSIKGYRVGAPTFLAAALLERNPSGSAVAINSKYINHGISSVSYNSSTEKIEVVLDNIFRPNIIGSHTNPIPQVAFTQEVAGTIVPRVGGLNRTAGTFYISFVDVTTGNFVPMPSGPWFMTFTVLGS